MKARFVGKVWRLKGLGPDLDDRATIPPVAAQGIPDQILAKAKANLGLQGSNSPWLPRSILARMPLASFKIGYRGLLP